MSIDKVKEELSKKYEFIKLIGKGGFAEVYLAKDKLLEREVAIKILLAQHTGDKEVVERFLREAKLYANFDHKNLIPIYETGIVNNNAFLVMKYVNGQSLKEIIDKQGVLNSEQTMKVVKGMASALKYIHNKGIIHRDIKPANILIENNTNRIYLADFGIARPISSKTLTQTGMLIGTPYYISPEQINKGVADRRSDIYALGTTLYEVISGSPIFKGKTPIEVLYKHVNEEPKPIASINPNITMEMKHIVEKCLEKNPNDRFQNANEILDIISTGKIKSTNRIKKSPKKSFINSGIFKFIIFIILLSGIVFTTYHFYPDILGFFKENNFYKKKNEKDFVVPDDSDKEVKKNITDKIKAEHDLNNKNEKIIKENTKKDNIIDSNSGIKKKDVKKVVKKSSFDNKEIKKKDIKKISKEDQQYNKFFKLAKKYYYDKNFKMAEKNINEAKVLKKTLELYELSEKIQFELKKIKEKNIVNKQTLKKKIKTISLLKLKHELLKSYIAKISMVRINITKNVNFFKNRVKIKGQLTLKLRINEKGRLSFQEINDQYLYITPVISKKKILRGIWLRFKGINFTPPVDKKGNAVILEKWRVTFIVSKFKNKIILRKV